MPTLAAHDIEVTSDGLDIVVPAGNYVIHGLSAFGPWMQLGADVSVEDEDFFENAEKIPGLNQHLPGRLVTIGEGEVLALRTHEAEVGDFKQRKVVGDEVVLLASTYVRLESAVPFEWAEAEEPPVE